MEVAIAAGGFEVPEVPGHEIVEADDLEALGEETVHEVRAQEPSRTRHQHRLANRSEPHATSGRFYTVLRCASSATIQDRREYCAFVYLRGTPAWVPIVAPQR